MDFDGAIAAHVNWKSRLASYIAKPDRSLNAAEVGADNKCQLGQWLNGEGGQYSTLPEFQALRRDHSRFHKAAADLIQKADTGIKVSEQLALGARSEFAMVSQKVVTALMAMKVKIGA